MKQSNGSPLEISPSPGEEIESHEGKQERNN